MDNVIPVILCGGNGTRMWPLSRTNYPKQFLKLSSPDFSLLQQTIQRIPKSCSNAIFVCNENHRFLVAEQLLNINYSSETILLEPAAKNTAPAIALAALKALEVNPDATLLVLASDHVIENKNTFHQAIEQAYSLAQQGYLATFGITPTAPETGFGYIKRAEKVESGTNGYKVAKFVEKPNKPTAQQYFTSGDFCWNSGMFMFKAKVFLDELESFEPAIFNACQAALINQSADLDFTRIDEQAFSQCPANSIDYAVMEKTGKAVVIPMAIKWSDLGTWPSLWDISIKDHNDNSCFGDVIAIDSTNNLIYSNTRLVSTLGVKNLVIVETADSILVAHKDQCQDIEKVVSALQSSNRDEHITPHLVHRPWGQYESLYQNEKFLVKRLMVKPGEALSLQMHHHRAEHWTVVSGSAKIQNGEKEFILIANQSTYIPIGTKHCLENIGSVPLEIIEVQSGSYLGDDDIVRFEDKYGRVKGIKDNG